MRSIAEIRRNNLELLIKEMGTLEAVASADTKTSSVYLSQVRRQTKDRKTGQKRAMGTAIARRLELACDKPVGWMDQDRAAEDGKSAALLNEQQVEWLRLFNALTDDTQRAQIAAYASGLLARPGVLKQPDAQAATEVRTTRKQAGTRT